MLQPTGNPRHPGHTGLDSIQWISDGFGFCSASGEWFTANETARAVLDWRRGGLDTDAIAGRLCERFQVTRAAALRDLQGLSAAWAALVGR